MKIRYSKPSADIRFENQGQLERNHALVERQRSAAAHLKTGESRSECLLCDAPLASAEVFYHREIPFLLCNCCGHIQSLVIPPEGYPHSVSGGKTFSEVYPALDPDAYMSRTQRIYQPKLQWLLECLRDEGYSMERLQSMAWVDLGSGAGNFLQALEQMGIQNFRGLEADENLVETANQRVRGQRTVLYNRPLCKSLQDYPADIYSAIFVLEHIGRIQPFLEALRAMPSGTVLFFSVPVLGLSAFVEAAHQDLFSKSLDGVLHTNLFTEESVRYAMNLADYEIKTQWVFGQDVYNLIYSIQIALHKTYPRVLTDLFAVKMDALHDPLQAVMDQYGFADSRHIVAVKR